MGKFSRTAASALFFISLLESSAFAQKHKNFSGLNLPPPPVEGSSEYQKDFVTLHAYQDHRTPAECAAANAESDFNVNNGFGEATGVLTAAEIKSARALTAKVLASVLPAAGYFKKKYHRLRPYLEDKTLNPCITLPTDKNEAYPSAHAAMGYALAIALASRYPEKKDAILKQGLQIGENRLIGGVHHPSDVEAGRQLATEIMKTETFETVY